MNTLQEEAATPGGETGYGASVGTLKQTAKRNFTDIDLDEAVVRAREIVPILRERAAQTEDHHEHQWYVVTKRGDDIGIGQRALNDQPDPSARKQDEQRHEHADGDHQHEHAVGRIFQTVQAEQGEIQGLGNMIRNRHLAPDHLHYFFDHVRKTKSEQQFSDMAEAMHPPQAEAFNHGADYADSNRSDDQCRPESDESADLIREIRTQHEETGMCEIKHTHHAEDQCQAARQHKQQHSV